MDQDDALDLVTEVTVSSSETKQIEQYEPAEATAEMTADVPEDVDPVDVERELSKITQERAKLAVMRRYEEYIRQSEDE